MQIFVDEIAMPIWLTIIISLCSGIICTVATLIVQHRSEKKRVKKELLLSLASLRDCTFNNVVFKNNMNKVQIVFYGHKKVIEKYNCFVEALATKTFCKGQKVIIDEFIAMLEAMAEVVGFEDFNWQNIKKKYSAPDYYNDEIEQSTNITNSSTGVKKRTYSKKDGSAPKDKEN